MDNVKRYELVYVMGENVTEEDIKNIRAKVEEVISKYDGKVEEFEDWGRRRLAYEIKKNKMGHYFRVVFSALPQSQIELTKKLRLDERVIRFMSLILKEAVKESTVEQPSDEESQERDINAQLQ